MIKLEPRQPCPFGSFCGHKVDYVKDVGFMECEGMDVERDVVFICELWAECYEEGIEVNA